MATERTVEDARRLERQLVMLRWLVAAFGAVQVGFAVRDHAKNPGFTTPLGAALVIGLVAGNLLISSVVRAADDPGRLRTLGLVAFALDATAILGLVWLATDSPADPVWVLGYLLPLEGAARWGLPGALVGASLFLGEEIARELDLAVRNKVVTIGWPALTFRGGMAFVVGGVAGSFGSSLRRQAALADERAREAEAAAERAEVAAQRERQARGEVAAFHAAVLAEHGTQDLQATLQTTADAIARELGSEALGILVRERGIVGETAFAALGVHGDPGYLRGQRLSPVADPVGLAAFDGEPVLASPDIVAPMRVRGELVGALHEHATAHGVLDEDRLLLLTRLADQLGLVLESARLRADQEATVRRLRELDEMKTDFVAITSHELRTPLSGIRGFVDMLRRRGDELRPQERDEFLDIVLTQTDRLVRLVEDLLAVSRVEAGKLTLEPEDTELSPFLERLVRAIGEGGARVRISRGLDAPADMLVDPRRLAQILTNLVHNALKYSPVEAPVDLRWETPVEGTVAFVIEDRGPGIPAEERELIFERFHQSERSIAHSEGFGLGLYITRLLTEAMGGWIEVRSEPGQGAAFVVTLPASRNLPAPARPSAAGRSG